MKIVILVIIFILLSLPCFSEDISFFLDVTIEDTLVIIEFENTGIDPAQNVRVLVSLDNNIYTDSLTGFIFPGNKVKVPFLISCPPLEGSYPLITRLLYQNSGQELSVLNVTTFSCTANNLVESYVLFGDIYFYEDTVIYIEYDHSYSLNLILPDEIYASRIFDSNGVAGFSLVNTVPNFNLHYDVYAIMESSEDSSVHITSIHKSRLHVGNQMIHKYNLFNDPIFYLLMMIGGAIFCFGIFHYSLNSNLRINRISLIRWIFNIFIISALYYFLYSSYTISDYLNSILPTKMIFDNRFGEFIQLATNSMANWFYFKGQNYDYFREYEPPPICRTRS